MSEDATNTILATVIAERDAALARLEYNYARVMSILAGPPVMTFDEWCAAIDAAIAKEKK